MKKKNSFHLILLLSMIGLLHGCGSDDPTPAAAATTTASVTEINGLPKSTGPVVSSGSSASLKNAGIFSRAASTGQTFANATTNSWSASHSRPFCESIGMVKDLYSDAASPDKILCYIGVMKAAGAFDASVYDGNYKYYNIVESGVPSGRVKFKVVKGSDGGITQFEMFSCFGSGGANTQDSYISQTVTNSSATVVSKNIGSGTENSVAYTYGGSVSATGSLNTSGAWTSKTITANRYHSQGSSLYGSSATITQGTSSLTLSGYFAGNRYEGNTRENFSNSFYSVAQILTPTSMSTFALGDGSSKYTIGWTHYTGGVVDNSFSQSQTDSWNGDTRAKLSTASTGDYYTQANSGTVPTVGTVATVTFSSAETWNCKDADGATTGFGSATISSAIQTSLSTCDSQFGQNGTWLSCWQAQ